MLSFALVDLDDVPIQDYAVLVQKVGVECENTRQSGELVEDTRPEQICELGLLC